MLLKIRKLFCVGIGYDMAAGASVQILSVKAPLWICPNMISVVMLLTQCPTTVTRDL